jgi:hypothetical protein
MGAVPRGPKFVKFLSQAVMDLKSGRLEGEREAAEIFQS